MPKRRTHEEYVCEIEKKYGIEYSILEEYKNKREKILIRHNKCGNEYKVIPNNLFRGAGCRICNENNMRASFIDEVKSLVGDEYSVLSEYQNRQVKEKF